jgi:hypothetical protein
MGSQDPPCQASLVSWKGGVSLVKETWEGRDHLKYGVTVGRVLKSGRGVTCGYVCRGWPTWGLAAKARGWTIAVVVLRDNVWEKRIRAIFGGAVLVKCDEAYALGCRLSIDVWLCDTEPPRGLKIFGESATSQVWIITCRRFRQTCPSGHSYHFFTLMHASCGGVTDGDWSVHVYKPIGVKELHPFQTVGGRDLHSVVDATISGYPCPPPRHVDPKVPRVIQLQPTTYHVSGLFPLGKVNVRFVVPSIFSSTGWVRRKLTGAEMCKVWDLPDDVTGGLNAREVNLLCNGGVFAQKLPRGSWTSCWGAI